MFPKNWTPLVVMQKILEALNNIDRVKWQLSGKIDIRGKTSEGISVMIRINSHTSEILTAFPIHDGWLPGELQKKARRQL